MPPTTFSAGLRRHFGSTTVVLALLILLVASSAEGNYREEYHDGVDAVERGAWVAAIDHFNAAIREQPRAAERILLTGVHYVPYLPHYYLGYALWQSGNCSQALAVWERSESQGVVLGRPEYEELRRGRRDCEERLAALERAAAAPTDMGEASRKGSLESAEEDVSGSEESVGPASVPEPVERRTDDQPLPALPESDPSPGAAEDPRPRLPSDAGPPESVPEESLAPDLSAGGEEQSPPSPTAPPNTTSTPQQGVDPPVRLREAVAAYLRGDYGTTLRLLGGTSFEDSKAERHACLFRAAAHHALYLMSGKTEERRLDLARSEVRHCRERMILPELDTAFFSPAFRELFYAAE